MRAVLRRVVRAARVVIHDPEVERSAKTFALLIATRLAIAIFGSAKVVEIVTSLVGG